MDYKNNIENQRELLQKHLKRSDYMIFKTQLWCSNSFKQGLICVNEGEDEYKKYINEQLNSVTSDESYKSYSNFSKTFGNLKIMISNDNLINNNGESDLNLTDNGYFIKLYDENSNLQKIVKIHTNLLTFFLKGYNIIIVSKNK